MLRVSSLNVYTFRKTIPLTNSNPGNISAILIQTFTDTITFKAKKIDYSVADKIQNSAKKLGDGGKLKKLLKTYPVVDSSKMIKVDVSESRYSSAQGEPPALSVKYNIWDNYLFSYALKDTDTIETRTFDHKGKPLSTTVERSSRDANIIEIYTGCDNKPFSIKVENKPSGFYSESGTGSVEKRYARSSGKSDASTIESYAFSLSNIRAFHYAISYPDKNRKGFNVYSGHNSKVAFSTLELAREHVLELLNKNCGNSAMEKLKGYTELLDLAEGENL